jgi:hypothetical protein
MKSNNHKKLRALTLALALMAPVSSATYASLLTFDFTVRISGVTNIAGVAVGDLLSGSYTFESTTSDVTPELDTGTYPISGVYTFAVGPLSFAFSSYLIGVGNNVTFPSGTQDYYTVQSFFDDGTLFHFASLDLASFANLNALTSDTLPSVPPDIGAFPDFNNFGYCFGVASLCDESGVFGTIESITLRSVPEPFTIALVALGLLGLGFARRRKR